MSIARTLCSVIATCAFSSAWAAPPQVPAWMSSQAQAVLPLFDDDTPAVLLYSETVLTVKGVGKIERLERRVFKILRREGESFGTVRVGFDSSNPVKEIRGWSMPAQGKAYEVGAREAIESGLSGIEGGELITDARNKLLRIPAATVGSLIGYEFTQEQRPYVLADEWGFQDTVPVQEARYSLYLPEGWSYKAFWLNHPEEQATAVGRGGLQWTVTRVRPIALEMQMPPWRGIAAKMSLSLLPPDGQRAGFRSWREVGAWYLDLTRGRRDASPEIRQKVQELTASLPAPWQKVQALASFVQKDIRYVAIELGIGGIQPHPAAEVFAHRYGDCKDKVTLLSSMLKEIGVDSHYVIVNTRRGSVTETTPPNLGFNHAIVAIQLPEGTGASALPALTTHSKLGKLLYFDPTQTLIPFGRLPGGLQAGYGMLVTPEGGELQKLPQSAPEANGVQRTAKLTLDEKGTLRGEVVELWSGDMAALQREALRAATQETDHIKPVESTLSHSLGAFQILSSTVGNAASTDQPLERRYTFESERYSKAAGDLLLVRPRVLGKLSSGLLETDKPRRHPIEFDGLELNTDVFEIALPAGYVADDIPPPVNQDAGFAAYRSKAEVTGGVLRYTRTFEIKELTVPVDKAYRLKALYRTIVNDERMSVVLKRAM